MSSLIPKAGEVTVADVREGLSTGQISAHVRDYRERGNACVTIFDDERGVAHLGIDGDGIGAHMSLTVAEIEMLGECCRAVVAEYRARRANQLPSAADAAKGGVE